MKIRNLIPFILIFACTKSVETKKLSMTNDELVDILVDLYTINATINANDISYRDSTSAVYYKLLADRTGKNLKDIESDIDKLLMMPDTFLLLQNRAIDTLRVLQEKVILGGAQKVEK